VPLNDDFDLYSIGADGRSRPAITHPDSLDDVVRGANGAFVGLARNY
jgi:general secretion pathway protein G